MSGKNQVKYTNQLHGKKIVVFGATSGIGYAVAEGAIEHGARVIVAGSSQERLDPAIERLKASYPESVDNIKGIFCNLLDLPNQQQNLREFFKVATDDGKDLIHHIAFTARNIVPLPPFQSYTTENMFEGLNFRLPALVFIGQIAPAYMSKEVPGEASIIITGGTSTNRPPPTWTVMAAASGASEGLMRGMAVELGPEIRVSMVAPGGVDTPLLDSVGAANKPMFMEMLKNYSLLKRVGRPDEIAQAFLYLMKDTFATGQIVCTDGGRLLKS